MCCQFFADSMLYKLKHELTDFRLTPIWFTMACIRWAARTLASGFNLQSLAIVVALRKLLQVTPVCFRFKLSRLCAMRASKAAQSSSRTDSRAEYPEDLQSPKSFESLPQRHK